MNPMQRRRLRAAGKLGSPGQVMIPQQQQEEAMEAPLKKPLIGSPQIDENHRRSQRMKITRPVVAPDPTSTAMWSSSSSSRSRTRASRSSSCVVQQGVSLPSEGNSDQQWCCWSQDPVQVNKGQEGSESSVVTDDEAIAVQSLLALELLGSSIQDSAASKKKKPKSSRTKKKKKSTAAAATTTTTTESINTGIAATRRVFVPALGITVLQRRVEPRRAAPRSGELSHPGLAEEEEEEDQQSGDLEHPRSRSKRKRAGKMPPKFQDSVLVVNQQKKATRKKSRRV